MPFGVPFGGISGIDYDPTSDRYLAISDDRAEKGPARYFELGLPIDDSGRFTAEQPDILTMTALANSDGQPYPAKGVDPESARRDPDSGNILYSSEGDASKLLAPFVRAATAAGTVVEDYPLPPAYLPVAGPDGAQVAGVRNNLSLEGLTISADGTRIVALTENALTQNGPITGTDSASPARVLFLDLNSGEPIDEFVYSVDAIGGPYPDVTDATGYTQKADRGASEILAVSDTDYIVVERGLIPGRGNTVQLFRATTAGATSIRGKDRIDGTETPMPKTLLFDFATVGINPDNVEGITWGPTLRDGSRTLLLCSDDNFNAVGGQHTMFHLLAIEGL